MAAAPLRGIGAVVGGFLIHFTLGTVYTFGNMNPYVTSYMRQRSASTEVSYSQSTWIFSLSLFGQGAAMAAGGLLQRKFGARATALIGAWTMSCGVLLTFFTVKIHLLLVMLTYGLMFGVGTGIAYAVAIAASMSWFPSRRGLVGGCVVAGFGGGSVVFNQVQTLFINPDDLQPNVTVAGDKFFDQESVLSKVPTCFLLLGGCYAAIQLLGALLLKPAPAEEEEEEEEAEAEAGEKADEDETVADVERRPLIGSANSLAPLLHSRRFWLLWATFLVNTQTVVYLSTQYKSFGLASGLEDHFLAIVGSVSSVFNAAFRIVWGQLHDAATYWPLMLALCCGLAALMGTFALYTAAWFYCGAVCLMFAFIAGNFALFPAVCARLFGSRRMAVNYGFLFTSNAVSSIAAPPLSGLIKGAFGWIGIFLMGAAFSLIGAAVTVVFRLQGRR